MLLAARDRHLGVIVTSVPWLPRPPPPPPPPPSGYETLVADLKLVPSMTRVVDRKWIEGTFNMLTSLLVYRW